MKSSQSEFLSWKKGRNKHNLNCHSGRIAACCSGIKQASGQVAGCKYRQQLPDWGIQERWSCLWTRTSLCSAPNRAGAAQPALMADGLLG